jgi:hypothetical protein
MNGNISPDAVRALAYQLWLERGGNGGSPEDDWARAEEILRNDHRAAVQDSALDQVTNQGASPSSMRKAHEVLDRAVEESFPASDPPAVHIKDEPPVNAGDKWKTAKSTKRGGSGKGATV